MQDTDKIILALLQIPGIGRVTIRKKIIIPEDADFNVESIQQVLVDNNQKNQSYGVIEKAITITNGIISNCKKLGIQVATYLDKAFPQKLLSINNCPVVLYYKGDFSIVNRFPTLAIIGTREPTEYGQRIGKRVGALAAAKSITTVSGLAIGCDTSGHTGTVEAKGKTAAVLANGLDTIAPKENSNLAERILETGGCLISEYPPFSKILRGNFVDRDRLQAALSDAIFVVETGVKGGTLHTVEFAEKYGRRIFCYSHPQKYLEEEKTQGNQMLIKEGKATGIKTAEDLDALFQYVVNGGKKETISPQQISFEM